MKKTLILLMSLMLLASCSNAKPTLTTPIGNEKWEPDYERTNVTTSLTTTTISTTGAEEYVASCEVVEYDTLARNPSDYVGHDIAYCAKVLQVIPPDYGSETTLRLAVSTSYSIDYKNAILATVNVENNTFLEDDFIVVYGKCKGTKSYESILGEKITLPLIEIWYWIEADSSFFVQTDEEGNQSFVFDGLNIVLSSEYTFSTIDNRYSDYYESPVIIIPATITNISNETSYLYRGDVKAFGSKGTSLDNIHIYFDDGDNAFNDLRSGATQQCNFYLLYDGDGDYYLEFRDYDFTIEIKYPVMK